MNWLPTRTATFLALVAALAFVLNTALHANHLMPASDGHFHPVSHAATDAAGHQFAAVCVAGSEIAAHQDGSAPVPGADTDANCCACTCCPAIVLPSLHGHAATFVVIQALAMAGHRPGDGIVLEGPRRPPKPLGIA